MKPLGKELSYAKNNQDKPVLTKDPNRLKSSHINKYGVNEMIKENIIQSRMMRMRQVTEYCALSRAYIYQKINEGTFPPGYMISPGIRAWEKSEIDKWLDKRIGRGE